MKIPYVNYSSFLETIEAEIERQNIDLKNGMVIAINFEAGGGYGKSIEVSIDAQDRDKFESSWDSQYVSRFPSRIKAAATALRNTHSFGKYRINHEDGRLTILLLSDPAEFVVITENDESQWEDETGGLYHFPVRYLPLLTPGTKVVYYKGALKNKIFRDQRMTDEPHYFGTAVIGKIRPDHLDPKNRRFAEIADYRQFLKPVLAKYGNRYIEKIPENLASNYWRFAVRGINAETYHAIVGQTTYDEDFDANSETDSNDAVGIDTTFESYSEGEKKLKFGTYYERDRKLRKLAMAIHGLDCKGCGFNFESVYGDYGRGYIHVHHLKPLSSYDGKQPVDPETDLTVLCANCHVMVHRYKDKTLTLDQLKSFLNSNLKEQ